MARVAGLEGEVGAGQVGAVGVGLHLGQGDGRLGHPAVAVADAVPAVLPALVGQAPVGRPVVLDVAVAVGVAEVLDPLDGPRRVGQQLVDQLAGHAPAPHLAEQHDEERGGVGRAVVDAPAAERERGGVAEAHLVEDAARLLLVAGVDLGALEPGQGLQHPAGQVGVDQQRHPRRQQRVAAEHRHEPRRPGGHHHPLGVVGVEDPQRAEVLGAAGHHLLEHRVVGLDLGDLAAPLGQPLGGRRPLHGLAAAVLRGEHPAVDDRAHLEAGGPLAPGRHHHLEGDQSGRHLLGARGADLHAPGHGTPR